MNNVATFHLWFARLCQLEAESALAAKTSPADFEQLASEAYQNGLETGGDWREAMLALGRS